MQAPQRHILSSQVQQVQASMVLHRFSVQQRKIHLAVSHWRVLDVTTVWLVANDWYLGRLLLIRLRKRQISFRHIAAEVIGDNHKENSLHVASP